MTVQELGQQAHRAREREGRGEGQGKHDSRLPAAPVRLPSRLSENDEIGVRYFHFNSYHSDLNSDLVTHPNEPQHRTCRKGNS